MGTRQCMHFLAGLWLAIPAGLGCHTPAPATSVRPVRGRPPARLARRPVWPSCPGGNGLRGTILDRRGRTLTDNVEEFDIYVRPKDFTAQGLAFLTSAVPLTQPQRRFIERHLVGATGKARERFHLAVSGLTRADRVRIGRRAPPLTGIQFRHHFRRRYPLGTLAAHVLGYLGEVSPVELRQRPHLRPGDLLGRGGVEQRFERFLRARLASAPSRAPSGGRAGSQPRCLPGHRVHLSLDADLQRVVTRAMQPHARGAVVVLEAQTGWIRALLSKPSFDLRRMAGHLAKDEARRLLSDRAAPMMNRATSFAFPPGASFAVVAAVAALATGKLASMGVTCPGQLTLGRRVYRDTERHGHANLRSALARSCNIFFFRLIGRLGFDRLAAWAQRFGLGQKTGSGLAREHPGRVPTQQWHRQRGGFRIEHRLNLAIGQGAITVTPLQLALLYAAVANGGRLYRPQLVTRIESAQGRIIARHAPTVRRRVPLADSVWRALRAALRAAVTDPQGVSRRAALTWQTVAGLTGSGRAGGRTQDHAWFAGYLPAKRPRHVVVVLVEHGGSGAQTAAPVAKAIFEHLALGDRRQTPR